MSLEWENVGDLRVVTLENGNGVRARVMCHGATLLSLHVPDRHGVQRDVVLGFDDPRRYLQGHPYFGSVVGRYANRIAGAAVEIDGQRYPLVANDGRNCLHGGKRGLSWVDWTPYRERSTSAPEVSLRYASPGGDEGFPGRVLFEVTYALTAQDALQIDWTAATDSPTFVNLTHHAYWNLAGEGDVLQHQLQLFASRYLPVDRELLPTGELRAVQDTPMDFRSAAAIGARLHVQDPQLHRARGGYDHCWVLDHPSLAARLVEPASGRVLEVSTTQPGIQLYTGNQLDGSLHGKRGVPYGKYAGLCLETQHFPDSPHHPDFPSTLLRPGAPWHHVVSYRFSNA